MFEDDDFDDLLNTDGISTHSSENEAGQRNSESSKHVISGSRIESSFDIDIEEDKHEKQMTGQDNLDLADFTLDWDDDPLIPDENEGSVASSEMSLNRNVSIDLSLSQPSQTPLQHTGNKSSTPVRKTLSLSTRPPSSSDFGSTEDNGMSELKKPRTETSPLSSSNLLNVIKPCGQSPNQSPMSTADHNGNSKRKEKTKRLFPGPAGILPKLAPGNLTVAFDDCREDHLKKLQEEVKVDRPSNQNPSQKAAFSSSTILSQLHRGILSQPMTSNESIWDCPAWISALQELKQSRSDPKAFINIYNITHLKRQSAPGSSRKIPFLLAKIKLIDLSKSNPYCRLIDGSSKIDSECEISGSLHKNIFEDYGHIVQVGSVLLLKDVAALATSKCLYINITVNNLVSIYRSQEVSHFDKVTQSDMERATRNLDQIREEQLQALRVGANYTDEAVGQPVTTVIGDAPLTGLESFGTGGGYNMHRPMAGARAGPPIFRTGVSSLGGLPATGHPNSRASTTIAPGPSFPTPQASLALSRPKLPASVHGTQSSSMPVRSNARPSSTPLSRPHAQMTSGIKPSQSRSPGSITSPSGSGPRPIRAHSGTSIQSESTSKEILGTPVNASDFRQNFDFDRRNIESRSSVGQTTTYHLNTSSHRFTTGNQATEKVVGNSEDCSSQESVVFKLPYRPTANQLAKHAKFQFKKAPLSLISSASEEPAGHNISSESSATGHVLQTSAAPKALSNNTPNEKSKLSELLKKSMKTLPPSPGVFGGGSSHQEKSCNPQTPLQAGSSLQSLGAKTTFCPKTPATSATTSLRLGTPNATSQALVSALLSDMDDDMFGDLF